MTLEIPVLPTANLIDPREFARLPADDERAFLQLFELCQRRIVERSDGSDPGVQRQLQLEYMSVLAAAVKTYGIDGALEAPSSSKFNNDKMFADFRQDAATIVASLRMEFNRNQRITIKQLSPNKLQELHNIVDLLRQEISNSEFPRKQRDSINKLLHEIDRELQGRNFDLGKSIALWAKIIGALTAGEALAINAPQAMNKFVEAATMAPELLDKLRVAYQAPALLEDHRPSGVEPKEAAD